MQDAHEFLITLFDALHEEEVKLLSRKQLPQPQPRTAATGGGKVVVGRIDGEQDKLSTKLSQELAEMALGGGATAAPPEQP